MQFRIIIGFLFSLFLIHCAEPEIGSFSEETKEKIRKKIKQEGFQGVVLISQDENILFRESIYPGKKRKSAQLYKKHNFPLGESTKTFTAYAIHILEEEKKISLTDPVSKHLKWFPHSKVTIGHLLRHTSGLPKIIEFLPYFDLEKGNLKRDDVKNYFLNSKLKPAFPPGEYWKYSRLDYLLLSYIIEKTSGASYSQFLKERIFTPLGLQNTNVDSNDVLIGNSGIYSTPEDLVIFNRELKKPKLISKQFRDTMLKKTVLSDSISEDPIAFGEGVFVGDYFYWTYGKVKGISNFVYHDLKSRIFITIVSPYGKSKGDLSSVKSALTEIIFEAKKLNLKKKTNLPNEIYIEDLMKEEKVPSLGIAVFKNYTLSWKKMYGTKSQHTLFRAGSLSKTMTATATLRLVESNQLDLYSNWIGKLKQFKVSVPKGKKRSIVNLDLLLSHTSGLTEKGNWDDPINSGKKHLRELKDINTTKGNGLKLYYKPGTKSRYSGGGYSIVQEILTERTGKSFQNLMSEIVFQPLHMNRSTFRQNLTTNDDRCDGYDEQGNLLPQKTFVTPELSSGGLWTTPEEVGLLFAEVAKAKQGKSDFLTKESAEYLLSPKMSAANLTVHALVAHGFFLNRTGKTEYFFHGGHTKGHKSLALFNAEKGYGVVIMTNSENGSKLIWRILRSISVEEKWDKFVN
ncbi:beta-lactamase family protein [Leptospira sp. 2 VSF19]|uniref:Beta-lactamase family protein n=1 Tax=Leptospira soteropolitanensis TaxID=2950025 RepID=A0AAW5VFU5_9LEPT|nr:serine hydrolase domain-containing protein [Leptospira soteropolitanensis]MCW7494101.1 beta-lactamase family protein [Leptospira soteropolitanensis]MCW7501633.1 beta-lactamase family protein [Leptospira soteropolitanensis]MCW7523947.1 beta-lactamase family protein [Leptospira soteropolitanensis]MCW7527812.1 beta-lactamase family protein [Leptospira soteropolitanensis]MCW7531603.1 beta-lactamase family protein [Leptospira soteropolitanensis]